jgi:hypothetical protein
MRLLVMLACCLLLNGTGHRSRSTRVVHIPPEPAVNIVTYGCIAKYL